MKRFLLLFSFAVLFACSNHSQNNTATHLLPVAAFSEQLNAHANATLLDVRTPDEFAGGHLKGAVNLNIHDADFDQRIAALDKSTPVFVYCKAGGRSADAASRLKEMGFQEVYDMQGGFMSWSAAGLPSSESEIEVVEKFTLADYERLLSGATPVLIDYYAPWCGPCKKMEPVLNQLTAEFAGKVQVVRINVDEAPQVVTQQKINNIPVITCIKAGKEIKRVSGFQDEQALRAMIGELMQ